MRTSISKPIPVLTKTYDGGSTKVKTMDAFGTSEIEWAKTRVSYEMHPSTFWQDLSWDDNNDN